MRSRCAVCVLVGWTLVLFACAPRESTVVRTVDFTDRSDSWEGRTLQQLETVCGRPSGRVPDGAGGEIVTYTDTYVVSNRGPSVAGSNSVVYDPYLGHSAPPGLIDDYLNTFEVAEATGRFWVNDRGVIYRVDPGTTCDKKKKGRRELGASDDPGPVARGPAVVSVGRLLEPSTDLLAKGTTFALRLSDGVEGMQPPDLIERLQSHVTASLVARGFVEGGETEAQMFVTLWFGTDTMQVDLGMTDTELVELFIHHFDVGVIDAVDGRSGIEIWKGIARYNNLTAKELSGDGGDQALGLFRVMASSLMDLFGREDQRVVDLGTEDSFAGL